MFGARQDPNGAYAAVIPRWVDTMLEGRVVSIHGDGSTTRDFCHVANVVQANVLAALTERPDAINEVYNVAVGGRTSLADLNATLRELLVERHPGIAIPLPRARRVPRGRRAPFAGGYIEGTAPAGLRADL